MVDNIAHDELITAKHEIDHKFECLSISTVRSLPYVVIVELSRPHKRNAINSKMWREIGDAFRLLGTLGDGCRCILLLGSGKSFCAGIDITDASFGLMDMGNNNGQPDSDTARKYISFRPKILQMQQCLSEIENCAVPVVAAIHGSCIGGGIDLISCADVRICTADAKFSVREAKLGLAADVGTLQRLPKIVGHTSRVRELCYTGEDFNGVEAERIGLVSRICPSASRSGTSSSISTTRDGVISMGLDICARIARNSPVAVNGTKLSLNYSRDHSVRDGLEHITMHNAAALMTEDLSASFMASKSPSGEGAEFQNLLPHARL